MCRVYRGLRSLFCGSLNILGVTEAPGVFAVINICDYCNGFTPDCPVSTFSAFVQY